MKKVIAVCGPTAVGKTRMGVSLAEALHGEVISGDSMQIYRTMDIGTAKVTEEEMQGIIHHMIDITANILNNLIIQGLLSKIRMEK